MTQSAIDGFNPLFRIAFDGFHSGSLGQAAEALGRTEGLGGSRHARWIGQLRHCFALGFGLGLRLSLRLELFTHINGGSPVEFAD